MRKIIMFVFSTVLGGLFAPSANAQAQCYPYNCGGYGGGYTYGYGSPVFYGPSYGPGYGYGYAGGYGYGGYGRGGRTAAIAGAAADVITTAIWARTANRAMDRGTRGEFGEPMSQQPTRPTQQYEQPEPQQSQPEQQPYFGAGAGGLFEISNGASAPIDVSLYAADGRRLSTFRLMPGASRRVQPPPEGGYYQADGLMTTCQGGQSKTCEDSQRATISRGELVVQPTPIGWIFSQPDFSKMKGGR